MRKWASVRSSELADESDASAKAAASIFTGGGGEGDLRIGRALKMVRGREKKKRRRKKK